VCPSASGSGPAGPPEPSLRPPRLETALVRLLLRLFFWRIEVAGVEHLPTRGGAVLVAWHPNALLDPALILAHCPRRVVFGARHGLFAWPGLGALLRRLGTVPIYRPREAEGMDDEARKAANRRSLDALARAVAGGSYATLFPEGTSHDAPHLLELRPGAARLYLRARQLTPPGEALPVLVPVGLHYDRKHLFGSSALLEFHPPLELPVDLAAPSADSEARRDQARAITALIDRRLSEVIQATESWELYYRMHRLRKLVRAERAARAHGSPGPASQRERLLGFSRIRQGYRTLRATRPRETAALEERVSRYDAELRGLGLEDHDLDGPSDPRAARRGLLLLAQAVAVYLLLPPLLVLGFLVNAPLAVGLGALARRIGREKKDYATLKVLLGAVAYPLVWLAVSGLVAWGQINLHDAYPQIPDAPWWAALVTFVLCSLGGWLALRYLRIAGQTYRTLRTRLTRAWRRDAIRRLLRERSEIFEATMEVATGLELPGALTADGRVVGSEAGEG
jgi:glycerol-3-phosphate O-acyltransferase/dihydroxyacetone phosphate acyltransferase